jgi:hypothetical protein
MLTDQEALAVYDELRRVIIESGFAWVADEVDSEVRLGMTEAKRIRTSERDVPEEFLLSTVGRYTKPATFTSSVEYNPRQRLGLLVDAVERASLDIADLHEAAIHILAGDAIRRSLPEAVQRIVFIDPVTAETRESSEPETRAKLRAATTRLRPLLTELREEI